jgi:hypothetical protein
LRQISDSHIQKRTPQGSFIWEWYGDVADEKDATDSTEVEVRCASLHCRETVSKAHTQKRSIKKRSPQGSFIWEWYGDVADEKESTDSTEIEVR